MIIACMGAITAGQCPVGHADLKVPIFTGTLDAVELGSWGSGTIEVDEEETYLEAEALRIETTGFFEGGRLELKEPLEADQFMTDPEGGYIRLVVKVREPEEEMPAEAGGPGGLPAGMFMPDDMPPEPGMEGFLAPPDVEQPFDEMPMPPDEGMMFPEEFGAPIGQPIGVPAAPPPKIERLRLLLVTDKGALDSGPLELKEHVEIVEDWVQVVVPLSRFGGTVDVSGGKIEHIALFGDVEETFWLGEMVMGYEEQPLIADAGEKMTAKVNQETAFEAAPQPEGVKGLYVWDFDDLNGIQEEGYGRETTWTFLTPGYYTVTLTVSDLNGQKIDRIDRIRVKVEE